MTSTKARKKLNRLKAAEQKVIDWYNRNNRSRRAWRFFCLYGNPNSTRSSERFYSFKEKYAKPAYDALVQRIRDHKEEVKGLRR